MNGWFVGAWWADVSEIGVLGRLGWRESGNVCVCVGVDGNRLNVTFLQRSNKSKNNCPKDLLSACLKPDDVDTYKNDDGMRMYTTQH